MYFSLVVVPLPPLQFQYSTVTTGTEKSEECEWYVRRNLSHNIPSTIVDTWNLSDRCHVESMPAMPNVQ